MPDTRTPSIATRTYAHEVEMNEYEREALRALVEGRKSASTGTGADFAVTAPTPKVALVSH